jgi:hypothetical protein
VQGREVELAGERERQLAADRRELALAVGALEQAAVGLRELLVQREVERPRLQRTLQVVRGRSSRPG